MAGVPTEIVIPVREYAKGRRTLNRIKNNAKKAGRGAIKRFAIMYRDEVQKRYEGGAHRFIKRSTREKRRQGKRAGVRPAIPPSSSMTPLVNTRGFASLVIMKERGGLNEDAFMVTLKNVRMSGGGMSKKVAILNEFGGVIAMRIPMRARAYLKALAMNVAGTEQAVKLSPSEKKPLDVTIVIPPRPVWQPAARKMLKEHKRRLPKVMREEWKAKAAINITYKLG